MQTVSPLVDFRSHNYLRHNQRRQEHLATLNLDLSDKHVLEVGAGIGDHSSFFIDRGCRMTITEARPENLEILRQRFPDQKVCALDLNTPDLSSADLTAQFELIYCYGTLYHLDKPREALAYMAEHCTGMLLLETCVSFKEQGTVNLVAEDRDLPSQSVSGTGCRPTRSWIFEQLKGLFPFVYLPVTQPWHDEFPLDWMAEKPPESLNGLIRAIFIASRQRITNAQLVDYIPMRQRRC